MVRTALIVVPYTWLLKYLVPLVDLKSKSMSKTIQNCYKRQKRMQNGRKRLKRPKIAKAAKTADFSLSHFQRRQCGGQTGGGGGASAAAAARAAANFFAAADFGAGCQALGLRSRAASARRDLGENEPTSISANFRQNFVKICQHFKSFFIFFCKFQKIQAIFWHFPKFRQNFVKFAGKNHRFSENSAKFWQNLQKKIEKMQKFT